MYKYDYDNRVEECSLFYPSDDISQGTIIKFENHPEDETYAIIVTGDCDIAQRKFGKYLSFCYILSLKTYVSDFLIQKLCIKKIERNKQCIFKRLRQIAGFERTSDDALENFVLYDEGNLNSLLSDESLIRDILTIQSFIQKGVFSLSDYKQLTKAKAKDLIDAIRSFPGDKFYINSIPDATIQNKGFVVNLRRISEIELSAIKKNYFGSNSECFAIAKLNPPYKQRMAQCLGAMFSDIGLPSDFEQQRDFTIEDTVKEFFE